MNLKALQTRIDKLAATYGRRRRVPYWAVISGQARPEELSGEDLEIWREYERAAREANGPDPIEEAIRLAGLPAPVEVRTAGAERLPCGFCELPEPEFHVGREGRKLAATPANGAAR
jgi:hypothetical protein